MLARAELLDHAKHPRNRGELSGAHVVQEEVNPLCGDVVTIYAKVEKGEIDLRSYKLQATSFVGHGCLISQAAASMLTEDVVGKPIEDVLRMERADMERLLGSPLSPSRVKCAMLPLIALMNGLKSFLSLRAQPQYHRGYGAKRSNPSEITSSLRSSQ